MEALGHQQVLALLRSAAEGTVELELEYDLNSADLILRRDELPLKGNGRKIAEIELREEGEPGEGLFGMTLRGGAYGPDPEKNRPLTVTGIRTGGAAHRWAEKGGGRRGRGWGK